jgi:ABC-type Fe3+ transport system substrate-binding protein
VSFNPLFGLQGAIPGLRAFKKQSQGVQLVMIRDGSSEEIRQLTEEESFSFPAEVEWFSS